MPVTPSIFPHLSPSCAVKRPASTVILTVKSPRMALTSRDFNRLRVLGMIEWE